MYFQISAEEAVRRNMRRERNKVAAAKCRQRRVDHTNRLLNVSVVSRNLPNCLFLPKYCKVT